MGGWWLTCKFDNLVIQHGLKPQNLLCDVTEALVLPDALKGLSQEWVERLVARPSIA